MTQEAKEAWITNPLTNLGSNWKHDKYDTDDTTNAVYEYDCLQCKEDGTLQIETLAGMSTAHAFEEASYECEGTTLAVRRGAYLYDND